MHLGCEPIRSPLRVLTDSFPESWERGWGRGARSLNPPVLEHKLPRLKASYFAGDKERQPYGERPTCREWNRVRRQARRVENERKLLESILLGLE